MIFDPEVLTSSPLDINLNLDKQLTIPRRRCGQLKGREIRMVVRQSSIRYLHDFLQLPELGKKTKDLVVDLWSIVRYYGR
jgi:hypothetical protein